jgi:hypothetical protein
MRSFIIIRNLVVFYNYNFEIGVRERRTAKGGRDKKGYRAQGVWFKGKTNGEWRTAKG